MFSQYTDPRERAHENRLAAGKLRLQNPLTGEFLHLSGQGTTRDINYSWLGFAYQAETLRARATARGEDWPFELVHRDAMESVSDGHTFAPERDC